MLDRNLCFGSYDVWCSELALCTHGAYERLTTGVGGWVQNFLYSEVDLCQTVTVVRPVSETGVPRFSYRKINRLQNKIEIYLPLLPLDIQGYDFIGPFRIQIV